MSVSQTITAAPGTVHDSRILRYTFAERVNHWIAGLSYIYCLITGLAFWSPYMFWLADLVGGGPTARSWHPWLGLIFVVPVLWMYRIWRNDMAINDADRAWKKAMGNYIRNEDQNLPPIWRFNYGQKLFFWVMFYGAILLLLSGLILWFPESIPWSLRWLRYLGVAVHVTAALATIGAFIIHVYMGTAMVRGGFTSIIRGEVSAAWAKMHHRLWYEQVMRGKAR
ncbi:MAG TPA: formate dehydrogenase subunit gamma [Terriglobales bacterium]|nr:formate dehydrogenase subunit gamma [Terriglobales bacterium]